VGHGEDRCVTPADCRGARIARGTSPGDIALFCVAIRPSSDALRAKKTGLIPALQLNGVEPDGNTTTLSGQSGEQSKVQRQGAGALKDRQDRVPAFALPDACGYDQPSEPPTGIQPGTLAVLFRVFATWRGGFGYSPDCLTTMSRVIDTGGVSHGRFMRSPDRTVPGAPSGHQTFVPRRQYKTAYEPNFRRHIRIPYRSHATGLARFRPRKARRSRSLHRQKIRWTTTSRKKTDTVPR
jgi:hypothetical protein